MAKVLVGMLVLSAIAVGAVMALRGAGYPKSDSGDDFGDLKDDFGDLKDDFRDSLADLDDAEMFRPAGL